VSSHKSRDEQSLATFNGGGRRRVTGWAGTNSGVGSHKSGGLPARRSFLTYLDHTLCMEQTALFCSQCLLVRWRRKA